MRAPWSIMLVAVLLAGCGTAEPTPSAPTPTATPEPAPVLMPDLTGLPSTQASTRLAELRGSSLRLISDWRAQPTGCAARPGSVVRQQPAPGTVLDAASEVRVWTAYVDLERHRGPCEPTDGDLGPVTGTDAELARAFYRFAADPSLGAPFVDGDVRTGIQSSPVVVRVSAADRADLRAWRLDTSYAERVGQFSALDVAAASGGFYELYGGVRGGCAVDDDRVPAELAGLRAISLVAPADTVESCLEWWSVTLFVDDDDRIAGVTFSLGSP